MEVRVPCVCAPLVTHRSPRPPHPVKRASPAGHGVHRSNPVLAPNPRRRLVFPGVAPLLSSGSASLRLGVSAVKPSSAGHGVHPSFRDRLRASKILQERAFANPKIEVVWNTKVTAIIGDEKGTDHLELEDTVTAAKRTLKVGGVFIFIGFKPNSGIVEGHARHDEAGYFITDERMMTSIPGLFAAGDVRSQLTRQITTAVGDATTAAIAVEKYLAALREPD